MGRTALAIAHGHGQSSDAVYAVVQDAQKFNHCPDVLDQSFPQRRVTRRSTVKRRHRPGWHVRVIRLRQDVDEGHGLQSAQAARDQQRPDGGSRATPPGVQAWYNLWVEADPTATDTATGKPTRVLFGLEEVWENNPALPSHGGPPSVLSTPYATYPGGTPATDPWLVVGRYWNACGGVTSRRSL